MFSELLINSLLVFMNCRETNHEFSGLLWLIRLGIRTKVIEQAESLRTGGTSLTLFKNGWSVLDAIGVGNQLRSQFLEIEGYILDRSLFSLSPK